MIGGFRREVAHYLAQNLSGVDVWAYEPERVSPPLVVITPPLSRPWVEKAETFTAKTLNLRVLAVVRGGSREVELGDLEDLVERISGALDQTAWEVLEISTPHMLSVNQTTAFPAVSIDISLTYQ